MKYKTLSCFVKIYDNCINHEDNKYILTEHIYFGMCSSCFCTNNKEYLRSNTELIIAFNFIFFIS